MFWLLLFQFFQLFLDEVQIVFGVRVLGVEVRRVFVALNGFLPGCDFGVWFRGLFALPIKGIAEIVVGLFLQLEVGRLGRVGEVLERRSQITVLVSG